MADLTIKEAIRYPLPCGCAGPKYISKCPACQVLDIERSRVFTWRETEKLRTQIASQSELIVSLQSQVESLKPFAEASLRTPGLEFLKALGLLLKVQGGSVRVPKKVLAEFNPRDVVEIITLADGDVVLQLKEP